MEGGNKITSYAKRLRKKKNIIYCISSIHNNNTGLL